MNARDRADLPGMLLLSRLGYFVSVAAFAISHGPRPLPRAVREAVQR